MRDAAARRASASRDESSSAPVQTVNGETDDDEVATPPRLQFTARNLLVLGGFLAASIAALYYLLPQLAGLEDTWHRIENGSPYWMFLALAEGVRNGAPAATPLARRVSRAVQSIELRARA